MQCRKYRTGFGANHTTIENKLDENDLLVLRIFDGSSINMTILLEHACRFKFAPSGTTYASAFVKVGERKFGVLFENFPIKPFGEYIINSRNFVGMVVDPATMETWTPPSVPAYPVEDPLAPAALPLEAAVPPPPERISLAEYALKSGTALDFSRKEFCEFCERMNRILIDLSNGALKGRNRFRELLLGVKAVGKTHLLNTVKGYVSIYHPDILVVYETFDSCKENLQELIIKSVQHKLSNLAKRNLQWLVSKHCDNFASLFDPLEQLLTEHNVKIVLLLDEFHFVYKLPYELGNTIVRQLSSIIGSNRGVFHVVVSGNSSVLRALALAKLPQEERTYYPSYEGIDLNSTKLQPKWIYPLIGEDFDHFCEMTNIPREDWPKKYYCSGGRPGLILENLEEPQSLILKSYSGDCVERKILFALFQCTHSINGDGYAQSTHSSEAEEIISCRHSNLLVPIRISMLRNEIKNAIGDSELNECLYRLADEGYVVRVSNFASDNVFIANLAVYFQLLRLHRCCGIENACWDIS